MRGLSAGQEAEDGLKAALEAEQAKVQAMLAEVARTTGKARPRASSGPGTHWVAVAMENLQARLLKIAGGE